MQIELWQIILILVFLFLCDVESFGPETLLMYSGRPLVTSVVVGLILGDIKLGMTVGATMQLMSLGLAHYGGSAIPDYPIGGAVGVIVAHMSGTSIEAALPIAVTVAMLGSQLNVLSNVLTLFFSHRAYKCADENQLKKAYGWALLGYIPSSFAKTIPVVILFAVGSDVISRIIDMMPDALLGAFSVMCGMLPALGMGILLRYMNLKAFFPYFVIGFCLAAVLNMPMVPVALFGFAAAAIYYQNHKEPRMGTASVGGDMEDEL